MPTVGKLKRVIHEIDPSLVYQEQFVNEGRYLAKVKREEEGNTDYFLKIGKHFQMERKILMMAQGIQGITHLVDTYLGRPYFAILKEYAPGKDLRELGIKIFDKGLQDKLKQTVNNLHSRGIVDLDIVDRNIVLSPDGREASIVDLDWCSLSRDIPANWTKDLIERDKKNLRRLFA